MASEVFCQRDVKLSRSRLRGHVSNKGKTQKEAVEAISSLSDRQFSIVAEIAPLSGTQFPTTNIFGSPYSPAIRILALA
jgi:hypothetical protein